MKDEVAKKELLTQQPQVMPPFVESGQMKEGKAAEGTVIPLDEALENERLKDGDK
jgi:hypothetical protein